MTGSRGVETGRAVLVVDDDPDFLSEARRMLLSNDVAEVVALGSGHDVVPALEKGNIGVILMDWIMPGMSGADLLPMLTQDYSQIPVIIMTAVSDLQVVVGCIKQGAFDYITKPIDTNRLLASLNKAFQISELASQNRRLREYLLGDALSCMDAFAEIHSGNPRMQGIFKIIESMHTSLNPVLLTGETGVGKELIARAIHRVSGLKGAFVPLNVAGLDDLVLDDTLFGHRKGAFTGANESREGLVAKAQGGTLFLDEVGDMGSAAQVKLLRLLQEREYYRLGSDALLKSDARIIAASNYNFDVLLEQGTFRRDLYHRLRFHHIHIPPLRERREDIPLLIDHFLHETSRETGRPAPAISRDARCALQEYDYPGNVRELKGLIHHAATCNHGPTLTMKDFLEVDSVDAVVQRSLRIFRDRHFNMQIQYETFPSLTVVEQMLIDEAMRTTGGNKTMAAELLGISRPTLNKKLAQMEEIA
jgi:DNA-binding NtrC family response regulator